MIRADLHYALDCLGCKIGFVLFKMSVSRPHTQLFSLGNTGRELWLGGGWGQWRPAELSGDIHVVSVVQNRTKTADRFQLLQPWILCKESLHSSSTLAASSAESNLQFCLIKLDSVCFGQRCGLQGGVEGGYWISYGRVDNINSKRETCLLSPFNQHWLCFWKWLCYLLLCKRDLLSHNVSHSEGSVPLTLHTRSLL